MRKYDFFLPRIEYVGQESIADGNCPGQFNFDIIKQWSISPHDVSIPSFIGLWSFYNNYVTLFESNIKQLRRLQCLYYRHTLPLLPWPPQLIEVFNNCKTNIITLPLLLRYDSSRPTFLKTDWFTGGIKYILMQPDN